MDYKQRPAGQTPNDIKDLQVTAEGMPQVSLDKQAIKPEIDSDMSLAQGRNNQQEESIPHLMGTEEVTVHERKDRGQGGRMSSLDPEIPKVILKRVNTVTTRITSKGKSKKPTPHERENQGNRVIKARI